MKQMQLKAEQKIRIIGCVIAFIMALGCMGCIASFLCFRTVFNYSFVLDSSREIGYAEGAKERIRERFMALAMPSDNPEEANIPTEVMESFFADYDMTPDIENGIAQAYGKGEFSTENMKKVLGQHILAYAKQKDVEHFDEVKNGLEETLDFFAEDYTMVCDNALLDYFGYYREGIGTFLIYACLFFILIFLTGMAFEWWLYWKTAKNTFFLMVYYALCPSAICFTAVGLYLGTTTFLYRLSIRPFFVRDLIARVGSGFFTDILYTGILVFFVTVAAFVLYQFVHFDHVKNDRK